MAGRKLKALGTAVFLALVISVSMAPGAMASGTIYTGENEGTDKLQVGTAGTLECTTSKLEGTVPEEEAEELSSLTLKPTASECEFGGQPAPVKTNDCAYLFGKGTNEAGHADLEVECAEGHKIEIHTAVCTATIAPQTVKGAIHYEEDTASSFIAKATATKIVIGKARTTASQPVNGCVTFPSGEIGTLTSTQTVDCFEDESLFPQANPTTPEGTSEGEAEGCPFEGS